MQELPVRNFQDPTIKDKAYVKSLEVSVNGETGGESIFLKVDVFNNGDKTNFLFTNATLTLNCYGQGSSSISICAAGFKGLNRACKAIEESMKVLEEPK